MTKLLKKKNFVMTSLTVTMMAMAISYFIPMEKAYAQEEQLQSGLDTFLSALISWLHSIEATIANLDTDVSQLQSEINTLEQRIEALENGDEPPEPPILDQYGKWHVNPALQTSCSNGLIEFYVDDFDITYLSDSESDLLEIPFHVVGSSGSEVIALTIPEWTGSDFTWQKENSYYQLDVTGTEIPDGLDVSFIMKDILLGGNIPCEDVDQQVIFSRNETPDPEPEPFCGDAVIDPVTEQCDDGGIDTISCNAICTVNSCGDGYLNTVTEQCDDGNPFNGDGCSDQCLIEAP